MTSRKTGDDHGLVFHLVGQLLVEQAKSVIVMQHALDNIKEKMAKHCTQLEAHLVKSYPVQSRIQAWVNEKFEEFRVSFL